MIAAVAKINYTEATRRTFEALGWDCGTDAMLRHLKREYGIKMNRATCSVYRSHARKAQASLTQSSKRATPKEVEGECVSTTAGRALPEDAIVSLDDLRTLRDLSRRHGKAAVLELAGLFA